MKIELPLETWTELFGFIPRSQLIQLVPHFGETLDDYTQACKRHQTIGDRQFVSFVQFFLHKCGNITLGDLFIVPSQNGNKPTLTVNQRNWKLPLADVPIPENVKNFKSIRLSNFDESVIPFLQEFRRNSLLDNVNLYFFDCPDFLFEMMTNFVPLFTNINSIEIVSVSDNNDTHVLDQLQSEYSELAVPMFTSARVLIADYNCRDFWFCNWLRIPREDGKPRVLFLCGYTQQDRQFSLLHFIKHIKKDFLEANQQAVSFFIKLEICGQASVQSVTLENGQTREKLVIKGANRDYHPVTISRYPMEINEEEWEEEMSKHSKFDYWQINRKIFFDPYPD